MQRTLPVRIGYRDVVALQRPVEGAPRQRVRPAIGRESILCTLFFVEDDFVAILGVMNTFDTKTQQVISFLRNHEVHKCCRFVRVLAGCGDTGHHTALALLA